MPMTSSYKPTFSLVARNPDTGQIAVEGGTYWFAHALAVPFVEAGVSAVATQALANSGFGPKGLALLKSGLDTKAVMERLLAADSASAERQIACHRRAKAAQPDTRDRARSSLPYFAKITLRLPATCWPMLT